MVGKGNRFSFTKRAVEALPVPTKGRATYYDERTPGLCVRVTTGGAKTFSVFRRVNGRPTRVTIGKFPETTVEQARDHAARYAAAAVDGLNPNDAKREQREAPTLQDLFDVWLAHAKRHKKTWAEDERKWQTYFAKLKTKRLADVTTADVTRWHASLGENHGNYLANRALALLSAMYGQSHRLMGYDGRNPCVGVTKFKESSRERFLQPDELRPFFEALQAEPPQWRDFWLLCLFTGARRGNVAAMAWADLDLTRGLWFLPGQVTKNGAAMVAILPPPAVAILETRKDGARGRWVFAAPTSTGHIIDPRKSWLRVTKTAGIENLRPHDLRRSLGSWQAIQGASMQVIGAALGHKDPKATAVYARLTVDPVRQSVTQAVEAMQAAAKGGSHAQG